MNDATAPEGSAEGHAPQLLLRPWFWHLIYAVARVVMAVRFSIRFRIEGGTPRGPVLLACKHVSAWDIPIATLATRRALQKRKPYFQMGSFIGYPVFGRIVPALKACGGFSVMRPKEVLRLRKSSEHDRAHIRKTMDAVNGAAEATRRAVLRKGGVIAVFPEGTRDAAAVRPVRSLHEIESAVAVAAAASSPEAAPVVVPATFSYGRARWWRRPVLVDLGEPIPVAGADAASIAARIEDAFRARWQP